MTVNVAINLNDYSGIRQAGFDALKNMLGVAGMVRFLQQTENGTGDYTKEKYNQPEMSFDEIDKILKQRKGKTAL
jgi:hypothetical protein